MMILYVVNESAWLVKLTTGPQRSRDGSRVKSPAAMVN